MEKLTEEQFNTLLGSDSLDLIITTSGAVISRIGKPERTIRQMSDLDPELAEAIRGVVGGLLAEHESKVTDERKEKRAQEANELLKEIELAGADASVAAAFKAAVALTGSDIDAIRAKEQAERDAEVVVVESPVAPLKATPFKATAKLAAKVPAKAPAKRAK